MMTNTSTVRITTTGVKQPMENSGELINQIEKDLCKTFKVKKLKFIDDGLYANVYHHPKNKKLVIKIAGDSVDYIAYIKWCAKHQDNPMVPKLVSIDVYQVKNQYPFTAVVVVMEKLESARNISFSEPVLQPLMDYVGCDFCSDENEKLAKKILSNHGCLKYLRPIQRFVCKRTPDMHRGNIMVRKSDGRYVVTDPVVG